MAEQERARCGAVDAVHAGLDEHVDLHPLGGEQQLRCARGEEGVADAGEDDAMTVGAHALHDPPRREQHQALGRTGLGVHGLARPRSGNGGCRRAAAEIEVCGVGIVVAEQQRLDACRPRLVGEAKLAKQLVGREVVRVGRSVQRPRGQQRLRVRAEGRVADGDHTVRRQQHRLGRARDHLGTDDALGGDDDAAPRRERGP